ncbi:MAG TPA: type II toxin-antitoxin system HicA family toxin [Bacteroidales bacterium]|nr:type II toxin-antitoxin system HicA family toxin [Bacteroidales bacterium]
MKVKEVIKIIEKHGWFLVSQKGSHRQYKHSSIPGRVTIPGNLQDDLPKGTFNSVLKQAGINKSGS